MGSKPLEVTFKTPPKRPTMYTKMYLTTDERREIIQTIGDAGVLLYEYYLRLAAVGDKPITDNNAAEYFGWNYHKVRRIRQKLIKEGWFKEAKYSINRQRNGVTYYIGKEAVLATESHLDKELKLDLKGL